MVAIHHSILFLALITSVNAAADNHAEFYDDRERGWYWYEQLQEDEVDEIEEPADSASHSGAAAASPLSAQEIIAQQKETFDAALATAVINPTPENIRAYLAISQKINAQAESFADSFKKAIWVNPEFDYSLTGRPTNTQAIAAYTEDKNKTEYAALAEIAKEKGLIYFFSSDCSYCKRFSPVLKQFAAQFGFTIIPITINAQGSEDFPYPQQSPKLQAQLDVRFIPALFLLDPDNNIVSNAGSGYSDASELIAKVLFADEQLTNQGVPYGGMK